MVLFVWCCPETSARCGSHTVPNPSTLTYLSDKPSKHWIKVKNAKYTQMEGREEMFERQIVKR
jgi:hypothetical protein